MRLPSHKGAQSRILIPILYIFGCLVTIATSKLTIYSGPVDTQVKEGGTIILPCKTDADKNVNVLWSNGDTPVAGTKLQTSEKYQIVGAAKEGEYNLKLQDVRVQDEGKYGCQVNEISGGSAWPVTSPKAMVTVLKNVNTVVIEQITPKPHKDYPDMITVKEGQPVTIQCISKGSNPAATITWIFRDTEKVEVPSYHPTIQKTSISKPFEAQVSIKEVTKENKLTNTVSELTITRVMEAHHNLRIACEARIDRYEMLSKLARTRLFVLVPPQVNIVVEPRRPHNEYHEHDRVTFSCQVIGRPDSFTYSWSIDGMGALPDEQKSTFVMTLTRKHHNAIVRCKATNFESSDNFIQVRIRYGPKFKQSLPSLYAASVGSTANLSCEVDANPDASFTWQRSEDGHILGRQQVLIRHRIIPEDFGSYECTASNGAEFSAISRKVLLARNSPPKIVSSPQQYANIGSSFRLECRVNSVPLPDQNNLRWIKNNKVISDDSRVRSYREDFVGGTTYYLHYQEVQSTDFGLYNCSVVNGFGKDSLLVTLTIEDNIPVAFIAGASIALLMVVIFMVVLLCVCRRGYWETRGVLLKESRNRRGHLNGSAKNGYVNHESPSKQPLQSGSQYPLDMESTYCGQTDLHPCDNDSLCNLGTMAHYGSADGPFLPASACAIHGHGSLLRSQAPKSPPMHPHAGYQGIDLSDLSPYQQNTLSQVLSPRHHSLGPNNSFVHQIPEENEENGQEDSVRSCDSGYGGPGHHPGEPDMKHHVTFHPNPCVIHPYGQLSLPRSHCPVHTLGLKPCLSPGMAPPLHRLEEDYPDYQHSTNV